MKRPNLPNNPTEWILPLEDLFVTVQIRDGRIDEIELSHGARTIDFSGDGPNYHALQAYVAGRLNGTVAIDWSLLVTEELTDFQRSVYTVTARIPAGERWTYGGIAEALNNPGASRAVGQALGVNPFPVVVPCHRVIRSDGTLGGFGGPDDHHEKRRLLDLEKNAKEEMPSNRIAESADGRNT